MKFIFDSFVCVMWIIVNNQNLKSMYSDIHALLLSNMITSRQFSVISENEIFKCHGHVCQIAKKNNQFYYLGKSTQLSTRSWTVERRVAFVYERSLTMWWRHFCRRLGSRWWTTFKWYKWENRYQKLVTLHRNLTQTHALNNMTDGRKLAHTSNI